MYRTGHLGVSLLVFAPICYLLVEAGLPVAAFLTGAAMCWLAMLPDVDHRLPLVPHRGPTHSLLFAAVVGGAFAAVGTALDARLASVSIQTLAPLGFLAGFAAVAAHLLGDALTPAGVPLFWPLSEREFTLSVSRADNVATNYLLFALGVLAVAGVAMVLVR